MMGASDFVSCVSIGCNGPRETILISPSSQHLRPYDRCPHCLRCHLHALLPRYHSQELPPLRMPLDKLWRPDYPGIPLHELLEVRLIPSKLCFVFVFVYKHRVIIITDLVCFSGGEAGKSSSPSRLLRAARPPRPVLKNRHREEISCAFSFQFSLGLISICLVSQHCTSIHGLLFSALRPLESRTMIKEETYRGRLVVLRKTLRYRRWLRFT